MSVFHRFFAHQLARPSGLFGRYIMGWWLRNHTRAVNTWALEQLALGQGDRLLEIGFGSGDVVRSARLREHTQRLPADYACTWAERGAEVLALALLIFVTALITKLGTLALALSGLAVAAYVAALGAGRFLVPRLHRWPRVQRALSSGLQASTPRRVAAMAALSLMGWASEVVMLILFQGAFHLEPSFRAAVLTVVGINAAIVIPTLPGNFGTFEAGATMALVMCGAPRDVAVLYALTYHLTHVLPVAVVATTVYLVRSRGHYGSRR